MMSFIPEGQLTAIATRAIYSPEGDTYVVVDGWSDGLMALHRLEEQSGITYILSALP